jgi:hypothetical protein
MKNSLSGIIKRLEKELKKVLQEFSCRRYKIFFGQDTWHKEYAHNEIYVKLFSKNELFINLIPQTILNNRQCIRPL